MSLKCRKHVIFILIPAIVISVLACASSSYINLKYQLPSESQQLIGKTVFIEVKDMRKNTAFLSETAKDDFKNFSGLFSLYLAKENAPEELLGGFKAETLFREALKNRLQAMGISVSTERKNFPVLELGLKEFFLDYQSIISDCTITLGNPSDIEYHDDIKEAS